MQQPSLIQAPCYYCQIPIQPNTGCTLARKLAERSLAGKKGKMCGALCDLLNLPKGSRLRKQVLTLSTCFNCCLQISRLLQAKSGEQWPLRSFVSRLSLLRKTEIREPKGPSAQSQGKRRSLRGSEIREASGQQKRRKRSRNEQKNILKDSGRDAHLKADALRKEVRVRLERYIPSKDQPSQEQAHGQTSDSPPTVNKDEGPQTQGQESPECQAGTETDLELWTSTHAEISFSEAVQSKLHSLLDISGQSSNTCYYEDISDDEEPVARNDRGDELSLCVDSPLLDLVIQAGADFMASHATQMAPAQPDQVQTIANNVEQFKEPQPQTVIVGSKKRGRKPKPGSKLRKKSKRNGKCPVPGCRFKYDTPNEEYRFRAHTKRVHEGIRQCFECQTCGQGFKEYKSLQTHEFGHTGEFPFQCSFSDCSKQFRSQRQLTIHGKVYHRPDELPYSCEFCGKKFMKKFNCELHLRAHTNERPFDCSDCGKRVKSQSNLSYHRIKFHGWKSPKSGHDLSSFACHYCEKAFASKLILDRHRIKQHGWYEKEDQKDGGLVCEACAYRTTNGLSELRRHFKMIHSVERPEECAHCVRRFKTGSALRAHFITVHAETRPHPCTVCNKAFVAPSKLKRHMLSHVGLKSVECGVRGCYKTFYDTADARRHRRRIHGTEEPGKSGSEPVQDSSKAGPPNGKAGTEDGDSGLEEDLYAANGDVELLMDIEAGKTAEGENELAGGDSSRRPLSPFLILSPEDEAYINELIAMPLEDFY